MQRELYEQYLPPKPNPDPLVVFCLVAIATERCETLKGMIECITHLALVGTCQYTIQRAIFNVAVERLKPDGRKAAQSHACRRLFGSWRIETIEEFDQVLLQGQVALVHRCHDQYIGSGRAISGPHSSVASESVGIHIWMVN